MDILDDMTVSKWSIFLKVNYSFDSMHLFKLRIFIIFFYLVTWHLLCDYGQKHTGDFFQKGYMVLKMVTLVILVFKYD